MEEVEHAPSVFLRRRGLEVAMEGPGDQPETFGLGGRGVEARGLGRGGVTVGRATDHEDRGAQCTDPLDGADRTGRCPALDRSAR